MLVLAALGVQSVWAIQNWVSKTDPALNDISDMSNWPNSSDRDIQFNVALSPLAPELWMSQSTTFGRVVLGATNLVFDLGAANVLTTGQNGETKLNVQKTSVLLKSGTYIQTKNQLTLGQNTGSSNCVFTVDGNTARYVSTNLPIAIGSVTDSHECGVWVRNGGYMAGNFQIGNNANAWRNWLKASGQGTQLMGGTGTFYVGNVSNSCENVFELTDGASLNASGHIMIGSGINSHSNKVSVNAATVATAGETRIGSYGSFNAMEVANSRMRSGGRMTLGYYASRKNNVRMTNSVLEALNGIYFGSDSSAWGGNRFEFVGGVLSNAQDAINVGYYGSGDFMLISNSQVWVNGSLSSGVNGSGATVRIVSCELMNLAKLNLSSGNSGISSRNTLILDNCGTLTTTLSNNGPGENTLEVSNGTDLGLGASGYLAGGGASNTLKVLTRAKYTVSSMNFGSTASFNTMIVDGGSFFSTNGTFCLGYTTTANSNTVVVSNGGYFFANPRLRIGHDGSYNKFIVNDGTVHVANEGVTMPFNTTTAEKNGIEFSGRGCLLESEGDVTVRRTSTLRFVVPSGGYTNAPIQTIAAGKNINLDPTTVLELDITDFLRGGGGKQVLARTANSFGISTQTLDSLNAQIVPQGCSISIVGKELILAAPHTGGTMLKLY